MILSKFKDFVGITEHDDDEEEYEEMDWPQQSSAAPVEDIPPPLSSARSSRDPINLSNEPLIGSGARNNVIGMPGINNNNAEVVVVEPHSFDEMPQVIQTLRERKSVVLNLNVMEPEEAQRAVDFVAGGTFAIDGHQERIGESIFLFTPNCVKVSSLSPHAQDLTENVSNQAAPEPIASPWGYDTSRLAQ